jgi:type VI secretion system secreted protein VgrG
MALPGLDAAVAALNIKADEGDFLVLGLTGHEHLGRMFEYVVEVAEIPAGLLDLLSEPKKVDLSKLIGTPATVHMKVMEDERYFHGHVTRAKHGPKRGRYETYTLTLQPWIWFMTQTRNSRVFQEKSVKDVLTELMKDYSSPSEWRLVSEGDYPKLDYCVQYDETDFDFFSRLLEEFGIYYFFEHEDKKHTLVFTDSTTKHKSRKGDTAINWANAMLSTSTITTWYVQQEVRSVKTLLTEYDYLAPTEEIKGEGNAEKKPKMLGKMEWFEHPARVVQNGVKPEAQPAKTLVTQQAKVRMEELLSLYASATGQTNVRDLGVGMTFDIDGVDDKGTYLMVSAIYRLDFPDHEAIEDLKSNRKHEGYLCDFLAISKDAKYRSPRTTPRPVIAGPQTAMVVGKAPNEIETDKHGRNQDPLPLGPAWREGPDRLVLGSRGTAMGRQEIRRVEPAAGRPGSGGPVPGRQSGPAARDRLRLQQRQHGRMDAARPEDGHRIQKPHHREGRRGHG